MATTTQNFSHLLAPGLRKVFFDKFKTWDEEYSRIATVLTSKRAYEEELITTGLGRFEQKDEGNSITYDNPIQGDKQRYTHVSYALGFRVTREMWQDDLYGVMRKVSQELAMSARQTVEVEFAGLLDDAFSGSVYTGVDGKALCATDHPLLIGGTYANEPSSQADLGIGSLRAASERMERTVSERGFPIQVGRGKLIVVSPTFQWIAQEIIRTRDGKPYTAENTMNAFNELDLSYTVNHFMSDDDMWFLLAPKEKHDIKFFWRQRPIFENSDDFDTKDAKFSGFMRFSFGWTDWRGVDGSSGG